jgi:hypothetical protein
LAGLGLLEARLAMNESLTLALMVTAGTLTVVGVMLHAHRRHCGADEGVAQLTVSAGGVLPGIVAITAVALGLTGAVLLAVQ